MAEEWRIDNSRQILESWSRLKEKYGDIPTFFTGDFNSNESSSSYAEYIKAGLLNSKYAAIKHSSRNIATFHKVGVMPPQGNDKSPIDHIFVSPNNIQVLVHSIETRKEVLEASDHCIIYADALVHGGS
jgi:endonuclease/exonuclease/phosphatase family metal-dependent hydrolase